MNQATTLRVRDYMTRAVVTFTPDTDLLDAIHALVEKRISGAPVVDNHGNVVGILTERDCVERAIVASYHGEAAGPVEEVMSRNVETVDADTSLMEIARQFGESKYRRYPVLEDNRLVGILSRRDLLRAVLELS